MVNKQSERPSTANLLVSPSTSTNSKIQKLNHHISLLRANGGNAQGSVLTPNQ